MGSLLLMSEALEWLGVAGHSSQRDATVYAYTAVFLFGVFLAGRGGVAEVGGS
jgi:hypothetical protein